jgi:methylase of polypeptide subunit release factors
MTKPVKEIWRYGEIDVMYERNIEGAGTVVTQPLLEFIQSFCGNRHFGSALDCFAGAGFIGFGLIAEGICDSLCLTDIDPVAMDYVGKNIIANQLQDRVHAYVSDNFASVPDDERFDLVVANPPWYWSVNPAHPLFPLLKSKRDIVAQDSGWRIHESFYSQVGSFLNPGALVFVLEGDPNSREVVLCGTPLDVRPEPPGPLCRQMMLRGGLTPISDHHIFTDGFGSQVWVQVSQKPG